jgi:hypothetical protein
VGVIPPETLKKKKSSLRYPEEKLLSIKVPRLRPLDLLINISINISINSSFNSSINSSTNISINSSFNSSINSSINSCINSSIKSSINLLKTKLNHLYKRNQSVPHCKHFPPRFF